MAAFEEKPMGFFTDTSICIGCKACEVACKEWNQLQGDPPTFMDSYDNTGQLDAQNWRHVQFIEQVPDNNGVIFNPTPIAGGQAWLMMSDVCKHCKNASCMEVCPTNAIMRTEFDTVYIQKDVCNGCRDCISACPYGVIGFNEQQGVAQKCTLCYDRLQGGLQPACAKACPTESIKFGYIEDLHKVADDQIVRTEFDTVYIQKDVCNGCRDCISACPYGVIGFNEQQGVAQKCTLCYDRLQGGLQPACAKACPTESIKFGYIEDLHKVADD